DVAGDVHCGTAVAFDRGGVGERDGPAPDGAGVVADAERAVGAWAGAVERNGIGAVDVRVEQKLRAVGDGGGTGADGVVAVHAEPAATDRCAECVRVGAVERDSSVAAKSDAVAAADGAVNKQRAPAADAPGV